MRVNENFANGLEYSDRKPHILPVLRKDIIFWAFSLPCSRAFGKKRNRSKFIRTLRFNQNRCLVSLHDCVLWNVFYKFPYFLTMRVSFPTFSLRSPVFAAAWAIFLVVWLSLVTVHVQHGTAVVKTAQGNRLPIELLERLDCLPFPIQPSEEIPRPECPVFELLNNYTPLSSLLPVHFTFPLIAISLSVPVLQTLFYPEVWIANQSTRGPPSFHF